MFGIMEERDFQRDIEKSMMHVHFIIMIALLPTLTKPNRVTVMLNLIVIDHKRM